MACFCSCNKPRLGLRTIVHVCKVCACAHNAGALYRVPKAAGPPAAKLAVAKAAVPAPVDVCDLTSNKADVVAGWSTLHDHAFASLKAALTNTRCLIPFHPGAPTTLTTDASDLAIGAVLMQDVGNGPQPVAFNSRKLSPAEQNYATHEKEALAIKDSLKVWRHYLMGMHFTCITDHHALRYLTT